MSICECKQVITYAPCGRKRPMGRIPLPNPSDSDLQLLKIDIAEVISTVKYLVGYTCSGSKQAELVRSTQHQEKSVVLRQIQEALTNDQKISSTSSGKIATGTKINTLNAMMEEGLFCDPEGRKSAISNAVTELGEFIYSDSPSGPVAARVALHLFDFIRWRISLAISQSCTLDDKLELLCLDLQKQLLSLRVVR